MNKVEEYRARARECETRAAQVHDPEVRRQFQDLARQWDQMADQRAELLADRVSWRFSTPRRASAGDKILA
jgi:hypothetical protein